MNVLFLSPGYPAEMPFFTRGLREVGSTVIGLGDQPGSALPEMTRANLAAYVQVESFQDEEAVCEQVRRLSLQGRIERIECLWEPLMILAARLREMLGLPGMTIEETIPFRDKEQMKRILDAAGIRTPKHLTAKTVGGVREAAEWIGYPLIVKPISGAGSKDTYRIDGAAELEDVLPRLGHVPEVSVEEFIEGEDFTFDTICAEGKVVFHNIAFYRPRALTIWRNEWISPQTVVVRDVEAAELAPGREMGLAVLRALDFRTGFTHMEWYRRRDGSAVFGEIAARPPGGRTVDVMNWASDLDLFRGWAEAACRGSFSQPIDRKYNAVSIMKRAQGSGRIQRIEGLSRILSEFGEHICAIDLTPLGSQKRSGQQSLVGDGFVMLRHPDFATALALADRVGTDLQLYAG